MDLYDCIVGKQIDICKLGVLAYEVTFRDSENSLLKRYNKAERADTIEIAFKEAIPGYVEEYLRDFIFTCLFQHKTQEKVTATKLLQHSLFNDIQNSQH